MRHDDLTALRLPRRSSGRPLPFFHRDTSCREGAWVPESSSPSTKPGQLQLDRCGVSRGVRVLDPSMTADTMEVLVTVLTPHGADPGVPGSGWRGGQLHLPGATGPRSGPGYRPRRPGRVG